jgi:hypothetical protein
VDRVFSSAFGDFPEAQLDLSYSKGVDGADSGQSSRSSCYCLSVCEGSIGACLVPDVAAELPPYKKRFYGREFVVEFCFVLFPLLLEVLWCGL